MPGYSRRRRAGHRAKKPAAPKQKKVCELETGGSHGKKTCDNQRGPQTQTCDVQNIQISAVYSLSQLGSNNNSSVVSRSDEDHHDPVVVRSAVVEYITLDDDTLSISSNESDCDIMEVGSSITENVSTRTHNGKDKSHTKFISSDLTEDDGAKHDPKENKVNEVPSQVFCCTPYWLPYIYKKQFQCTCAEQTPKLGGGDIAGSSSPVGQSAIELESCAAQACLIEDRTNTVQKGSTSTAELRLTQKKRQESNDNSEEQLWNQQKTQREGCGAERRKSQREISHLKGKQDTLLNTVLELKTLRTGNNGGANGHQKVHPSESQLYKGKEEAKTVSMDSDIVFIPLNKSDSDVMEAEGSLHENVRKALSRQNISQEVTPTSPMSKLGNEKLCNNANTGKADQNKKIPNTDDLVLSSIATVDAGPSDHLSKDKTAVKIQNITCRKEFCCILSWSAYVHGEKSKCNCTFVPSTTNKSILKNIQPDKPWPESSCETTEILASPKLDANKSNIGNKRGKGKKVRFKFLENSQLELKKEEQSPQTQLCKNLVVKDRSRKVAFTPIRDSEIDEGPTTESSGLFKDGSSSFKRSSEVCPARPNCFLRQEVSERSFSSEEAFERFPPTMADKKDTLIHNLGVHIQNSVLMKSFQNTQTSTNMCDVQNIQISGVYSLSPFINNNNSFVVSRSDEDHHDPVVVRPAKVEYIRLDDDTMSISSNESDCDIIEIGSSISKNVSTTKYNSKDKNHTKFISIDLTEDGGTTSKPKLSVLPTVSSPISGLENSNSC